MSLTTTSVPAQPAPALLFIPDISGFTQFVNDTEINHARHIVEELLNILIESNRIQLEVSEVEGDAILFCRLGDPPTARELFDQIRQMFTAFHVHVQKYDTHRICNCGACKTASALTLKFIAHYGEVAINQVQQFKKLFGLDVITVHRLLKNDIEKHEYALFTEALIGRLPDWSSQAAQAWSPIKRSSQEYDSGAV
ncbi:MAG TPA: DUF2652 domain-containing protein, partial [Saprospiraceae bacterium]|nr:DUF2652 domain-containing protein [Saprospiraceae bacterium]